MSADIARATPRPWDLHNEGSVRLCRPDARTPALCRAIAEAEILHMSRAESVANAALIVVAVNNHEALLAAIHQALGMLADAYGGSDAPYAGTCSLDGQRLTDLEEAVRVLEQAAAAAEATP